MMRRTAGLVVATVVTVLMTLTACGGADTGPASEPEATTRTVTTSTGEVEVPVDPQRVVVLNVQQASMVVSLGVTPVAVAGDLSVYPWLTEKIEPLLDPALQDEAYTPQVEAIAALDPDLILIGNWQLADAAVVEQLQALAPVVSTNSQEVVPSWQDSVTTIGQALGVEDAASQLIADIETSYAALGERTGVTGLTYQYVALEDQTFTSGNGLLFQVIGLEPGAHQDVAGSVSDNELSVERLSELDADLVLVWNASSTDLDTVPGLSGLPAARAGNLHEIDLLQATALTGPDPIGLQGYLLEMVTPMIEQLGGEA